VIDLVVSHVCWPEYTEVVEDEIQVIIIGSQHSNCWKCCGIAARGNCKMGGVVRYEYMHNREAFVAQFVKAYSHRHNVGADVNRLTLPIFSPQKIMVEPHDTMVGYIWTRVSTCELDPNYQTKYR
jgi:hypothetical protein